MEFTLNSKKETNIKRKTKIEYDIDELEEYLYIEISKVDDDTDIGLLVSKLMYRILLFHLEDYRLNEDILRREISKYFQMNNDELINKIP